MRRASLLQHLATRQAKTAVCLGISATAALVIHLAARCASSTTPLAEKPPRSGCRAASYASVQIHRDVHGGLHRDKLKCWVFHDAGFLPMPHARYAADIQLSGEEAKRFLYTSVARRAVSSTLLPVGIFSVKQILSRSSKTQHRVA